MAELEATKLIIPSGGVVGEEQKMASVPITVDLSTGDLVSGGTLTGKKIGIFASLDASADTTVTTAGTYYPIAGTFNNDPVEGFAAATVHTPGIKYTESLTQYFEIDWHASFSADGAGTTVMFGVKKNGSLIASSVMGQFCKNLGQLYALSGTTVVSLAEDDEIQLVLTSDSDGDVITMDNYTTTISEFFD